MASRNRITPSQKDVLLRKFNDGMQGCGQDTLNIRQSASAETGLPLKSINLWINNHKKRHLDSVIPNISIPTCTTELSTSTCTTQPSKRMKVRAPSAYNAFSKDFHQQDLKGKSFAEKSSLMAKAWREMSDSGKEKYKAPPSECNESRELSHEERKKLIVQIAKRHQEDANLLQSLGCEVATMMFTDGQTITIGTNKGKQFLQSHSAILSSFNAYFLYDDLSRRQQSTVTTATSTTSTKTAS